MKKESECVCHIEQQKMERLVPGRADKLADLKGDRVSLQQRKPTEEFPESQLFSCGMRRLGYCSETDAGVRSPKRLQGGLGHDSNEAGRRQVLGDRGTQQMHPRILRP